MTAAFAHFWLPVGVAALGLLVQMVALLISEFRR